MARGHSTYCSGGETEHRRYPPRDCGSGATPRPQDADFAAFGHPGGALPGRTSDDEITLFKSVGIALEDLTAAVAIWEAATTAS